MIKSESIVKLADALVKAQAEMPTAKMDKENPFYKSHYATLGAVIDAAKPILAKNNLAVSQPTIYDGNKIGVETILIHSSGEYISNICCIPIGETERNAQIAGSTISYLRRYGLAALLGIYSDEDDDSETGKKKAPAKKESSEPKPKNHEAPWEPVFLRDQIQLRIKSHNAVQATPDMVGLTAAMIAYPFEGVADTKAIEGIRHSIVKYLFGYPSLKDASGPGLAVLLDWLKPVKDSGGAYTPDKIAQLECQAIWKQVQAEAGQVELPGTK